MDSKLLHFVMRADAINNLQLDSMRLVMKRSRSAHFTNIDMRINGKNEISEADWLKHFREVEPGDIATPTYPQGDSNPGGKFKDRNGVDWYVKSPGDEDVAKSEVLSAKLYAADVIAGQDAKLITKGGKLGIASSLVDVNKASAADLAKADGAAEIGKDMS